jgi:hypothetical protein
VKGKGRKRKDRANTDNFYDFLIYFIHPRWEESLEKISMKQRHIEITIKGVNYVWLQLFKDMRKVNGFSFTI